MALRRSVTHADRSLAVQNTHAAALACADYSALVSITITSSGSSIALKARV